MQKFDYLDGKFIEKNGLNNRIFALFSRNLRFLAFYLQFPVKMTIIASMQRHFYRNLQEWAASGHKKPLMLRGVRQCGKTHLLKYFGASEFSNFHSFNFEKEPELTKI